MRLFQQFLKSEAKGGLLLFFAAVFAFALSNSPLAPGYFHLREIPLALEVGNWRLKKDLLHFTNDFLMAVFFLLVGLELKRELLTGELKNPRRAGLAIAAALGGMLVPALFYLALNRGGPGAAGWGVPMATDIAFALGALALLGSRVPAGLKVFLTALAIVDDLGAVLVIALFYSAKLNPGALALALAVLALLALLARLGVKNLAVYLGLGLFLWYFVLASGIHATVAGVLLAFAVPIVASRRVPAIPQAPPRDVEEREALLEEAESRLVYAQSPLHRLEHALHPWVAYGILPVFAFLNAGVTLAGATLGPVALGVLFGLLLGKPMGILLFSALAVRSGLARLPEGVGWGALAGAAVLAGVGFTMALFIASLAFGPALLDQAKVGVLLASLLAAVAGLGLLARKT